jgi:hypothetical protein
MRARTNIRIFRWCNVFVNFRLLILCNVREFSNLKKEKEKKKKRKKKHNLNFFKATRTVRGTNSQKNENIPRTKKFNSSKKCPSTKRGASEIFYETKKEILGRVLSWCERCATLKEKKIKMNISFARAKCCFFLEDFV